jgi:hypothetical protein
MIPSLVNISYFLSRSPFKTNRWNNVFSMNGFCLILICFLVIPTSSSLVLIDAQILSVQNRNNGSTSSQLGDGLLSILKDSSVLSGNLSSAADKLVNGVEKRIDTRLEGIKDRIDDIAAVAIPVMIAAVAGIVFLAALIIAFIVFYWYERIRQGRRHKRNLVHLSEHILQELKANVNLLEKSDLSSIVIENKSSAIHTNDNNNDRPITQKEVSNSALKVAVSSSLFWDLPSNAQYIMLMLGNTIDGFNKGFQRVNELTESITLNKIDQQTAPKVLKRYETDLSYYKQYTIDLSNQLKNIMEARARKGVLKTKS